MQEFAITERIKTLQKKAHDNQIQLLMDKHPRIYNKDSVFCVDENFMKKRTFEMNLWDEMWDLALKNRRKKILPCNLLLIAETLYKRSEILLNKAYFPFYPDPDDDNSSDDEEEKAFKKELGKKQEVITNSTEIRSTIYTGLRNLLQKDHQLRSWTSLIEKEEKERVVDEAWNKYIAEAIAENDVNAIIFVFI
jgi:hypothetical protein